MSNLETTKNPNATPAESNPLSPVKSQRSAATILVVDDHTPLLGYPRASRFGGLRWLASPQIARAERPDLIVSDIGIAAALLPFEADGRIAVESFQNHLHPTQRPSLDRTVELERLALRDAHRLEFRIYTGNDLGINVIEYGSDYLLGLAVCAREIRGT